MKHNFDEVIDRYNTNSLKYDFAVERGKPAGLIPLWVADMDFRTAPCVTEALVKSAEHAIFGYSDTKKNGSCFAAVREWFSERLDFKVKPEWLVKTPGVVFALYAAVRASTGAGDGVLIQPPVYYPFREAVEATGRRLVTSPLSYTGGKYGINFNDFEDQIIKNNVKAFILCSPHNPVGRVWTKNELTQMGRICLKHNVTVISDEIHCDFVYGTVKHTVFGAINEKFLNNSIICTAPSKTFNLAGLQAANIFIAEPALRTRFREEVVNTGYSQLNTMGLVAAEAAYRGGGEWLDELLVYLEKNYNYVKEFINANLPKIHVVDLEGTYLLWLDMNAYGFSETELERIIVGKARLWVSKGSSFGEEGKGFIRVNIACPLSTLEKAFNQLAKAL
ncbi:MAG: pyridoxal phosphate-dependent aminotransferase [Treponema sp.]|jgi:cystathionine beta-lyase|nr:pyridoxal phosphate-dependent aminotransferase [Treponema sp.]